MRAATLPSWSQRSTEAGSLRLSGVLALKTRSYRCEENKEEQEEGEGEGCGIDDMMSQLSSRYLRAPLGRVITISTNICCKRMQCCLFVAAGRQPLSSYNYSFGLLSIFCELSIAIKYPTWH